MQFKEKALSLLLSVMLGVTMLVALPAQAYAAAPDLEFTVAPGSNVSTTQIVSVDNPDLEGSVYATFPGVYGGVSIGSDQSALLGYAISFPHNVSTVSGIGNYVSLVELKSDGTLLNYGRVQLTNNELQPPTAGSTTVTGGQGKVTVSSYAPVSNCKLYLVPSSLYPVGGGIIDISNTAVIPVTANGEISGLPTGNYTLYTVYTFNISPPYHGSYLAGAEVAVTAAGPDICQIGTTGYPTLDAALAAANSGDTIKFLTSISEYTKLEIYDPDELTIDLNGFDWDLEGGYIYVGGGTLTVTGGGNVTIEQIDVISGGTLFFNADYTGEVGLYSDGEGSTVTVVGNFYVNERAVNAWNGGVITVTGDIFLNNTGNDDEHYAVLAVYGSTITINGNIKASGSELVTGVYCEFDSKVIVNGTIDAPRYISLGYFENESGAFELILAADDHDEVSSRSGYLQYSRIYDNDGVPGSDYVWVRIGGTNPNPDPGPTIPKTGDFETLLASSCTLLFALMGAGALVVSRRKVRQS